MTGAWAAYRAYCRPARASHCTFASDAHARRELRIADEDAALLVVSHDPSGQWHQHVNPERAAELARDAC